MDKDTERRERRKVKSIGYFRHDDERLDQIADLFVKTVVAERQFSDAGREFLDAGRGINRQIIADHVAVRFVETFPSTKFEDMRAAVWKDLSRMFGWRDLADLDVRGRA
jgi:hypothetical protein